MRKAVWEKVCFTRTAQFLNSLIVIPFIFYKAEGEKLVLA
jgi:hypothetical protein